MNWIVIRKGYGLFCHKDPLIFLVFVACVDAWMIVDFHDDEFAINLFHVDAVKSLSHDAACLQYNYLVFCAR